MIFDEIYKNLHRNMQSRQKEISIMGAEFWFPVLPFVGATAILLGICIAVPVMAYQKIEKSGSLIERIRVIVE